MTTNGRTPRGRDSSRPGDEFVVLLIDDDELDRALFTERILAAGHRVVSHPSVEAALEFGSPHADVVVLDLGLPGISGFEGVRSLRAALPAAPVIVLTGNEEPGLMEAALEIGAHDFVSKDDGVIDVLERAIQRAVRRAAFSDDAHYDAMHDPLTGLPNRHLLDDRLSTLAAIAERARTKIGVLFLDLDRLKPVNDSFGHHVGDRLLAEFARRVAAVMRPADTVARVGGDEFVVLVGNVVDDADVETVAGRLIEAVRRPYVDPDAGEIDIAVSVGVATGRPDEVAPDTLLVLADRACLEAKADPGATVRWSMTGTIGSLWDPGARVPLTVYYQPILEHGRVVGHEALARVIDTEGAVVEPSDFLHSLRLAGRLPELDCAVIAQALADARLVDLGDLSVNVAPETLRDERALERIVALIERRTAPVTVEITEQAFRIDTRIARSLRRLRDAGARLALDDFGAGNADLAKLIDIEVDIVKLDKHFVRRLALPERAVPVIEAILGVCERLGHTVVVEGVEREDQLARFEALGAHRWQGYLAARPRPLAELGVTASV